MLDQIPWYTLSTYGIIQTRKAHKLKLNRRDEERLRKTEEEDRGLKINRKDVRYSDDKSLKRMDKFVSYVGQGLKTGLRKEKIPTEGRQDGNAGETCQECYVNGMST